MSECACGWESAYVRDTREHQNEVDDLNEQLDDLLDFVADLITHWEDGADDISAWFSQLEQLITVRGRALVPEDGLDG